jgi:hypothetical protein
MTTTPADLSALDFPAPMVPCDLDADHSRPQRARWRAVYTCGCVDLLCAPHAEKARRMHNAAVRGEVLTNCGTCHAVPVLLSVFERIPR